MNAQQMYLEGQISLEDYWLSALEYMMLDILIDLEVTR
jgi:hypothetical protein